MDLRERRGIGQMSAPDGGDKVEATAGRKDGKSPPGGKRTSRYLLYTCLGLIVSLVASLVYPRSLDIIFGVVWSSKVYAVIIDSGSTGSRLLAFTFRKGSFLNQQLQLEEELWEEVKPGLSSYADDPKSAANSISKLLVSAKRHIPEHLWSKTPITLKATAGLRLLPALKAEAIIEEVEKVLMFSGFKIEKTLVEIMNPRDEGLFAWFTVNFLLDNFSQNLIDSFVSLDLGGGSTQITFAPSHYPVQGLEGRKHFLHNVTILGDKREVYTHSYLGLGLMAARQSIFTAGRKVGDLIYSSCMASKEAQKWDFHGQTYTISGMPGETSFDECYKIAGDVIRSKNVHVPSEIDNRNIAAFSYFYDRALDNGIITMEGAENRATIQAFIDAAKAACRPGQPDDSAFQCVDLTFIVSLLMEGYGLPATKELHLLKKINGHETSWALGVAYSIVEER